MYIDLNYLTENERWLYTILIMAREEHKLERLSQPLPRKIFNLFELFLD